MPIKEKRVCLDCGTFIGDRSRKAKRCIECASKYDRGTKHIRVSPETYALFLRLQDILEAYRGYGVTSDKLIGDMLKFYLEEGEFATLTLADAVKPRIEQSQ